MESFIHPCHRMYSPMESFILVILILTTELFVLVIHPLITELFILNIHPCIVTCVLAMSFILVLSSPFHHPHPLIFVCILTSSSCSHHIIVHVCIIVITHTMSTIKFDHVPLKSAQNFPRSLEPAACTTASEAKEKTAFKEWWQEGNKAFCDNKKVGDKGQLLHLPFVCLKRSVIHNNDEPLLLASSTSSPSITPPGQHGYHVHYNSLLPDILPYLSPLPPVPVCVIPPSDCQLILPPSTPATAVVVSPATGVTASVGTRHVEGRFAMWQL